MHSEINISLGSYNSIIEFKDNPKYSKSVFTEAGIIPFLKCYAQKIIF